MKEKLQVDRRSLIAMLGLSCATGFYHPSAAQAAQTLALPTGAVTVVAFVRARSGKEAELSRATEVLVSKVRQEAGNLLCQAHRGLEDASMLLFYEIFESAEAFQAHNGAPHTQEWSDTIKSLTAGPVELKLFQAIA